jgi:hypothetical protein
MHYSYAEGAHAGLGQDPLITHRFRLYPMISPMLRLQLNQKTAISAGYSTGTMGWGYGLFMPEAYRNTSVGVLYSFTAEAEEVHRFPLLVHREFKRLNFKTINSEQNLHTYSIGFSYFGGAGLNYRQGISPGTSMSFISFNGDSITLTNRAHLLRKAGAFVTAGATTRFYRLGREKLNLTLFVNQGLTDMLAVDINYQYNRGSGTDRFRVRGSSVGLMLGVPIRLKTYDSQALFR